MIYRCLCSDKDGLGRDDGAMVDFFVIGFRTFVIGFGVDVFFLYVVV